MQRILVGLSKKREETLNAKTTIVGKVFRGAFAAVAEKRSVMALMAA